MALERSGECKLAKLVSDHILGYINRNVLLTVMNSDGVTDELREYGRRAGPGLQNFLLVLRIHGLNTCKKLCFYIRCFLKASAHLIFPPYLAFLRFTMNLSVLAFLFLVL